MREELSAPTGTPRAASSGADARARLARAGAQQALTQSDEAGTRRVLQALVRDERLMGAAVCSRDGRVWAESVGFPPEHGCGRLPRQAREVGPTGWDRSVTNERGSVHLTALPVGEEEDGEPVLLVVHDMIFVDRRADTTRRYTFFAFALVGDRKSVV